MSDTSKPKRETRATIKPIKVIENEETEKALEENGLNEENCDIQSQTLDIEMDKDTFEPSQLCLEDEKRICSTCEQKNKDFYCDMCKNNFCYTCEDIAPDKANYHYHHYLLLSGEMMACQSCQIEAKNSDISLKETYVKIRTDFLQKDDEIKLLKEQLKEMTKDRNSYEECYREETKKVQEMKEKMENKNKKLRVEDNTKNDEAIRKYEEKQEIKKKDEPKKGEKSVDKKGVERNVKIDHEKKEEKEEILVEKIDNNIEIEKRKNEICPKWLVIGDTCELREKCTKVHPMTCLEKSCSKEEVNIGKYCGKIHVSKKDLEILEQNKTKAREQEKKEMIAREKCRDYMNGYCRFGNSCWRKHITRKEFMKTIECKYYKEGRCNRGSRCEYKHMQQQTCRRFLESKRCFKEDSCEFLHVDTEDHKDKSNPIRKPEQLVTRKEMEEKETIGGDFLERTDIEQIVEKIIEQKMEKKMTKIESFMQKIMSKMSIE